MASRHSYNSYDSYDNNRSRMKNARSKADRRKKEEFKDGVGGVGDENKNLMNSFEDMMEEDKKKRATYEDNSIIEPKDDPNKSRAYNRRKKTDDSYIEKSYDEYRPSNRGAKKKSNKPDLFGKSQERRGNSFIRGSQVNRSRVDRSMSRSKSKKRGRGLGTSNTSLIKKNKNQDDSYYDKKANDDSYYGKKNDDSYYGKKNDDSYYGKKNDESYYDNPPKRVDDSYYDNPPKKTDSYIDKKDDSFYNGPPKKKVDSYIDKKDDSYYEDKKRYPEDSYVKPKDSYGKDYSQNPRDDSYYEGTPTKPVKKANLSFDNDKSFQPEKVPSPKEPTNPVFKNEEPKKSFEQSYYNRPSHEPYNKSRAYPGQRLKTHSSIQSRISRGGSRIKKEPVKAKKLPAINSKNAMLIPSTSKPKMMMREKDMEVQLVMVSMKKIISQLKVQNNQLKQDKDQLQKQNQMKEKKIKDLAEKLEDYEMMEKMDQERPSKKVKIDIEQLDSQMKNIDDYLNNVKYNPDMDGLVKEITKKNNDYNALAKENNQVLNNLKKNIQSIKRTLNDINENS